MRNQKETLSKSEIRNFQEGLQDASSIEMERVHQLGRKQPRPSTSPWNQSTLNWPRPLFDWKIFNDVTCTVFTYPDANTRGSFGEWESLCKVAGVYTNFLVLPNSFEVPAGMFLTGSSAAGWVVDPWQQGWNDVELMFESFCWSIRATRKWMVRLTWRCLCSIWRKECVQDVKQNGLCCRCQRNVSRFTVLTCSLRNSARVCGDVLGVS